MKKVKILHCADLHFDTPFKELTKDISERSREELLEVFKRIIDLVIENSVQVLLISGDVFDNVTVNKTTIFFIINELKRIKDVSVFISPGNHDPYSSKSFYELIDWPDNVHVFNGEMSSREINELGVVVWGTGFKEKYQRESLMKLENLDKSKINLMVIHGEISSKGSKNDYNPIYLEDIKNSNIDYIALGHIHKYSGILKEGSTYYAYPGCPQGRGFDEDDSKGVIVGNVYKGGVDLKFVSTEKRRYIVREIDLSDCNTYEELKVKIKGSFKENERKNNLFKIILTGTLKEHFNLNEKLLQAKLKDEFYFVNIIDKTSVYIDLEELSQDYSIKGSFVNLMLDRIKEAADDEKEVLYRALKLGIQCLSEEEVNLIDN